MARIRTVKPEFFRHELLQDLEITYQGKCPMLVFEGLWGHCDKAGRFEWKPRQLKLDILPFLPFDMAETLKILEQAKLINRYSVGGVEYGEIPSFTDHQRISGKESEQPERFPGPIREAKGKHKGKTLEATGFPGREGKGSGNGMDKNIVGLAPDDAHQGELQKTRELRKTAVEIIVFLNEKAGKNYQSVKANVDLIVARLKEGGTPDDMRAIIAKKCREWQGRDGMEEYLRPATLFGSKNFWQKYQGEIPAQ